MGRGRAGGAGESTVTQHHAIVVRPPALLFILGGAFLAFSLVALLLSSLDPLVVIPSGEPSARGGVDWFRVGALTCLVLALGVLLGAATSSVRVDHRGTLSVRSYYPKVVPPWKVRRVDLAALEEVTAREAGTPYRNVHASRVSTALILRDAQGRRAEVNPEWWTNPQPLLAALRHGVEVSSPSVTPLARRALDDPTTGTRI